MQRERGWKAPGSGNGYPHGKDKQEARAARARERALKQAARTHEQQIAALDRRFGKGAGAKRERARLAKLAGRKAA